MAYVETRPPVHHRDFHERRTYMPSAWNPKDQEVIVIGDSSSPERITHHEPPSNNTRNAAMRRRKVLISQQAGNLSQPYHAMPSYAASGPYSTAQTLPLEPYGSSIAAYNLGLNYAAAAYTQNSSSTTSTNPYSVTNHPAYRSSYTSPYTGQQQGRAIASGKRKREDALESFSDYAGQLEYSRNVTYTTQSSVSSRQHSRIYKKNLEVILRKEVDTAHNLGGRPYDDPEGHYIIEPQSELTQRYQIEKLLGQGTFGKVVRAFDRSKRTWVAIKIIRAVQKYRDASMIELRVLRTLKENDPYNRNKCIHLQDCFDYRNHVCIVTELLNISIFDFLKSNSFAPFPHAHIIDFASQLFQSVAFLHKLDLIHTDLKPENILLVDNASQLRPYESRTGTRNRRVLYTSELRLIDFGSATFQDEYHSNVVSTRHYRAPEIILGMGWSFPCDIWSIGCILVEFYTGDALFQTHDNLEHLAMMEVVCGRIDGRIIRSCSKIAQKMFRPSGRLDYPNRETSKDSKKFVKQMRSLAEMFPSTCLFNYEFKDLLSKIFAYDPKDRITAEQALRHPFFGMTLRSRLLD